MKGTINWIAPEMVNPAKVSAEADVWAFGMTTLVRCFLIHVHEVKQPVKELFTCKNPFHYITSIQALIAAIARGHLPERPSDKDTQSRMTDMWWKMCSECWNQNPSLRPTMAAIVDRIAEIVGSPLAAVFLVTYRSLQMKTSHPSVPNGVLQMNGSIRPHRYNP